MTMTATTMSRLSMAPLLSAWRRGPKTPPRRTPPSTPRLLTVCRGWSMMPYTPMGYCGSVHYSPFLGLVERGESRGCVPEWSVDLPATVAVRAILSPGPGKGACCGQGWQPGLELRSLPAQPLPVSHRVGRGACRPNHCERAAMAGRDSSLAWRRAESWPQEALRMTSGSGAAPNGCAGSDGQGLRR